MKTFLSILRGINVSGHKMIKMADLKLLYEGLGFKNIATYIQSGNVVFQSADKKDVSAKIQEAIAKKYGFEVPVIIRDLSEMEEVVKCNPFLKEENIELDKLHVTFLSEEPSTDKLETMMKYDYTPDRFTIIGKEVYLYCPGGYGNTKLNNNFFENKLKLTATTRNWKTVNELLRLMQL